MTEEEQDRVITELVHHNRAINEQLWRLQGRINALELLNIQALEDLSRFHGDSKLYMRDFVERAKKRAGPFADVDNPALAKRTIKERDEALEKMLVEILRVSGGK